MKLNHNNKSDSSAIVKNGTSPTAKKVNITQASEIIEDISRFTHLSERDALCAFSMMITSIKNHLLQGHCVNLGDLGKMSPCACSKNKALDVEETKIAFAISKHLKYEFQERAIILKHLSDCAE